MNEFIESKFKKLATLEFNRDRKSMSVLVENKEKPATGGLLSGVLTRSQAASDKKCLFVKGAPEQVIERCSFVRIDKETVPMTPKLKDAILRKVVCEY